MSRMIGRSLAILSAVGSLALFSPYHAADAHAATVTQSTQTSPFYGVLGADGCNNTQLTGTSTSTSISVSSGTTTRTISHGTVVATDQYGNPYQGTFTSDTVDTGTSYTASAKLTMIGIASYQDTLTVVGLNPSLTQTCL
jgi:hypothetical protein